MKHFGTKQNRSSFPRTIYHFGGVLLIIFVTLFQREKTAASSQRMFLYLRQPDFCPLFSTSYEVKDASAWGRSRCWGRHMGTDICKLTTFLTWPKAEMSSSIFVRWFFTLMRTYPWNFNEVRRFDSSKRYTWAHLGFPRNKGYLARQGRGL